MGHWLLESSLAFTLVDGMLWDRRNWQQEALLFGSKQVLISSGYLIHNQASYTINLNSIFIKGIRWMV